MSERAENVAGIDGAGGVPLNSVEPDLGREIDVPSDDPSALFMRPELDWFDEDAIQAVNKRRDRETREALKGLARPEWVLQNQPAGASQPQSPAPAPAPNPTPSGSESAPPKDATADRSATAAANDKSKFTTEPLAEPPASVSKRYLQAGSRYFLRDGSQQLAFEDSGARMVTAHNRPDIAESMAEMALAKGWPNIRVKGHEDFRRDMWLHAAVRGIGVTGYAPNEVDRARLEELMAERMTNRVEQAPGREQPGEQKSAAAGAASKAAPEEGKPAPAEDGFPYTLVKHGAAPYRNEKDASPSYFVTVQDAQGATKTVWGVDLARAMPASGVQPGDRIALANLGRQAVMVDEPVRDEEGRIVGTRPKETDRNVWEIKRVEPTRSASAGTPDVPSGAANLLPTSKDSAVAAPAPSTDIKQESTPVGESAPATVNLERSLALPIDVKGHSPESEFRGTLVAHGAAPYQNREGAQRAYFVTLRDESGSNVTVWGADLERAIAGSGAQEGDRVMLSNYGRHRVTVPVPISDRLGHVTGVEPREIERYVWNATVEPRERAPAAAPIVPEDPSRAMHLAVIAEAMRAQGFSERSVAKVQAKAGVVLDKLGEDGVAVPAPRVFDPSGRAQQPRSRGEPVAPSPGKEVERALNSQPASPGMPGR
ncbi:LPD7 domain-containing protein [Burkholderia pyrrocinia]|uniref:LPD7 domain-containing protein n=1 Tax=Burkholderia pyrrocinia TaxID=60550 RepID=UPI001BCEF2B2|nr:LPD7 domain-containing protein [Burkholderia pyrrocinia]QVN18991.1 hypothetical protein JYG32_04440 [Burkholderia pyrrocinia]